MSRQENISEHKKSLLIGLSSKIYHGEERELEKRLNKKALHSKQLAILISICELERATPAVIASNLGLSPSQMSRHLSILEANKYLSRIYDVSDRRFCLLKLLPRGEQIINASKPILSSLPQSLLSVLSEEEKAAITFFLENFPTD